MAQIIIPHDMPEWVHPPFQTAVDQFPELRHVVRSKLALRSIALLAISAVQNDVQVTKAQISKGLLCITGAERIKFGVKSLHLCLKEHDASRGKVLGHNDLGVGAIGI